MANIDASFRSYVQLLKWVPLLVELLVRLNTLLTSGASLHYLQATPLNPKADGSVEVATAGDPISR